MKSRIMLFLSGFKSIGLPELSLTGVIELFILFLLIYNIVKAIRNTRAWVVFKGIIFILISYLLFKVLNFYVLTTIIKSLSGAALIAVVIIFSDNIRKLFEKIGQKDILSGIKKEKIIGDKKLMYLSEDNIDIILESVYRMSKEKTGALLVFEREGILKEYADTGIVINSDISNALIENIFYDKTPLHDGATIIKDNLIHSATCYLPLSKNPDIAKDMGTRHRAAIGLTENTDAVVIVVSEETGAVSYSKSGKIKRGIKKEELKKLLIDDMTIDIVDRKISIKDIFLKNIVDKIIALALSFIVWFSYMNIISPPITKIIENVPYQMINSGEIEKKGKTYDPEDLEQVINVSVHGDASEVNAVKKDDIKAYVDLRKISVSNASEINVSIPKYPNLKVEIPEGNLINLEIDDLVEAEWDVDVEEIKKPEKGNIFEKIEWDNGISTVKISGPKNKVSKIGRVFINLDLSNLTNGSRVSEEIIILDKNGERMNLNIFRIDNPIMTGEVRMKKTKSLPLNVDIIEGEDFNYYIKEIKYEPQKVLVAGSEDVLSNLKEVNIPIRLENKDIQKNVYKIIKNIKIEDFVDEGISVSTKNSKNGLVEVSIEFEPKAEETENE